MNGVNFVIRASANEERNIKKFEIFTPDGGGNVSYFIGGSEDELDFGENEIIILPPLCRYTPSVGGVVVCLEQAALPFKDVRKTSDDEGGGIRHAVGQALRYFYSDFEKKDVILSALGKLLAGYAAAFCVKKGYSPVVEGIISCIAKNLSDPTFALDYYIKKLPLSYDYVRKLFKKEVGVTPHDYLLGKRMELATELLSSGISNQYSNYSISQVAEACGYGEPLYFSRVFKKYYGVAPSDF